MSDTTNKKNYALPIAMMFALFFMIAFVTGLPSPMGVIAAKQFNATNFESQLGFFANFIAYAFMGIHAGLMLKKIGYKKTALAAIIVGFIGVGIQFFSGQLDNRSRQLCCRSIYPDLHRTILDSLSVTFGDSSPRGRAKSVGPAAHSGPGRAHASMTGAPAKMVVDNPS